MQVGQERAAVEMTPGSFLGVVIDRELCIALRASEPSALRMLGPHVHSTPVEGQLDPINLPGGDESQQVAVELGVTHLAIIAEDLDVVLANITSTTSPTQKPEAPEIRGYRSRLLAA